MLKLKYETVPSKSRAGVKHTVTVVDWKTPVACTCERFRYEIARMDGQPFACTHMQDIWKARHSSSLVTWWAEVTDAVAERQS